MKFLKFTLQGEFALFRKATVVNDTTEKVLTYSVMPITQLKGIIGAIMGYQGIAYAVQHKEKIEFLDKLKQGTIALVPNSLGVKTVQAITNTTGFGNKGATMVAQQEILTDVSYTVYIGEDVVDFTKLCGLMQKNKTMYPLTFGRKGLTAHYADVSIQDYELSQDNTPVSQGLLDFQWVTPLEEEGITTSPLGTTYGLPFDYVPDDSFMYEYKNFLLPVTPVNYRGKGIVTPQSVIGAFQ